MKTTVYILRKRVKATANTAMADALRNCKPLKPKPKTTAKKG